MKIVFSSQFKIQLISIINYISKDKKRITLSAINVIPLSKYLSKNFIRGKRFLFRFYIFREKSYFLLKRQLAITPACGGHTHQEQTQKARDTSAVPGAGDISGNTHS